MGGENPVSGGVVGGVEDEVEGFGGEACGFGWVDPGGADLGPDAGLELLEGGAGLVPVVGLAEVGEVFEEGVDGGAQGAGEKAALVTGVELGIPGLRIETWGTRNWFVQGRVRCWRGTVVWRETAEEG
jgi:hypothetical protein